jgi:Leu/Phe-tRNA-protein transferase
MNVEKSFRKFLRASFKARFVTVDGAFNTVCKGKVSKAEIQNPATVIENLEAAAKLLKDSGKAMTFLYQADKKSPKAEITVSTVGEHHFLTMKAI